MHDPWRRLKRYKSNYKPLKPENNETRLPVQKNGKYVYITDLTTRPEPRNTKSWIPMHKPGKILKRNTADYKPWSQRWRDPDPNA